MECPPALAAISLQPCTVAAYEEMCRHAGLSGDAARRQVGATGYLDDVTLIQHPEVVVAGLRVLGLKALTTLSSCLSALK